MFYDYIPANNPCQNYIPANNPCLFVGYFVNNFVDADFHSPRKFLTLEQQSRRSLLTDVTQMLCMETGRFDHYNLIVLCGTNGLLLLRCAKPAP